MAPAFDKNEEINMEHPIKVLQLLFTVNPKATLQGILDTNIYLLDSKGRSS